ncbi:MAG TPA: DUF2332 domain-containing protein [Mycobacteriales bacterium]
MTREDLARRFRRHAASTGASHMYRDLMGRLAEDIESGGPAWSLMRDHGGPPGSVPALRLLGAVHRLVLGGRVPELARWYPSAGGAYEPEPAWVAFREVLAGLADEIEPHLDRTVQTNEVARSAVLLPGFCTVAAAFDRPLRVLEVGASAGLLLRFDAYRYVLPSGATWGPESSPLTLSGFRTEVPLAPVEVAERRGCDRSPIDASTEDGRLWLMAYVWPDNLDRFERLRAALDVAAAVPVRVDRADAVDWTRDRLAEDAGDAVPVVFHSVVMRYLSDEAREAFRAVLSSAAVEPRAWLRFEEEADDFVLRLTTWPGGEDRLLARAHGHGYDVEWLTT